LGALRDIKKEWIQHYFNYISKGTAAEGAEILIIPDPIVCRCGECGKDFEIDREGLACEDILCPNCTTQNYTLISGTKFQIEGIEVI
jgi:hydrogenase nickel incorporation protein HypA/HybF